MKKTVVDQMMARGSYQTRSDADRAFEHVFGAVREVLAAGEKVSVLNFGSFQKKFREGREGRNPRTGETVTIAARDVITFKPSKSKAN